MTQAAITTNVHQSLDVHLNPLAEVAFDLAFRVENGTDLIKFVFTQIPYLRSAIHSGFTKDIGRTRSSDPVNIRQPYLCPFVGRQIYTCYTSHIFS